MKKKILAVVSAFLISLSIAIPVYAVNPFTIAEFALECSSLYDTIKPLIDELGKLGRDTKIERQAYYLSAWSQVVKDGNLSVDDFNEYYTQVLNSDGNVIDGVDYNNAYILLIESTAYGLSYERLVELLFASGSNGCGVTDEGQPYIDKNAYESIVTKNPSPITVGGRLSRHSSLFSDTNTYMYTNFYASGTFTHDELRELYTLPFYYDSDNDKYYYAIRQFYYTQVHGEKDSNGLVPISLGVQTNDIWLSSDWTELTLYSCKLSDYSYIRFLIANGDGYPRLVFYNSYEAYLGAYSGYPSQVISGSNYSDTLYDLSDIALKTTLSFYSAYSKSQNTDNDVGLLYSDKPFIFTSSINFDNIPDTSIIYPSGGDIYIDDTADNKEGDTIYNYIYNDYIFNTPDNPSDDSGDDNSGGGGSSGTTSGDVTVSGRVEVDGSITIDTKPIDININVNSGSSGSLGTTEAAPSYIDGKDIELDKYLDLAPEMSDGFIDFVKKSLAWLPAEILGLLILGLVIAVWLRIVGR